MITQIQFLLPYQIALPDGEYEVYAARRLRKLYLNHPDELVYEEAVRRVTVPSDGKSVVSANFTTDINLTDAQSALNEFKRCSNITLTSVNRLIRWYRVQTDRYYATELELGEVWFILFSVIEPRRQGIKFADNRPRPRLNSILDEKTTQFLKGRLVSPEDPELEEVLLLDAKKALNQHRYKECIIICWSLIESLFDPFIREKLREKLPDIGFEMGQSGWNIERDLWFLTRIDILPRLLFDFSFKELPDDFWQRLSRSREIRNRIMHSGMSAEEEGAAETFSVTEELMRVVKSLKR